MGIEKGQDAGRKVGDDVVGTEHHEQMKQEEKKRMALLDEGVREEVNESEQVESSGLEDRVDKEGEETQTDERGVSEVKKEGDEEEEEARNESAVKEDRIKSLNHSTLYLGNLHPYVDDAILHDVFAPFEGISELKVIKDRATGMSAGYGFARFFDREAAGIALDSVKGHVLFGQPMKVNWALQKEKEDALGSHHHVFVGDLSADVTDQALFEAFSHCEGCSDARVMWDFATGRTKGYGFVSFVTKEEAQKAIETMDGAQLGSRCIRCGWAQHKTESALPADPRLLDQIDPTNTNIYVGNMPGDVSTSEARGYFSKYGTIVEMKLHRKGNYGFVRYKTHFEAVNAIVGLSSGEAFNGRKLKCSWGSHPKVPPSGVKAQLMMAAVSQGSMVHNPHQTHRSLVQQGGYGSQPAMMAHGFSQGTLFTTSHPPIHLDRDATRMMDPIMDGMSGMSLYGNQPLVMPPPPRLQPHHVGEPMPNQYYGTRLPQQASTGAMDPHNESERQHYPTDPDAKAGYGFQN